MIKDDNDKEEPLIGGKRETKGFKTEVRGD